MSVSWPTRTLGDLYQIGSSKRVLKSDWKTNGVPFYRGREVTRLSVEGFVDNELFLAEDHFSQLEKSYGVPKTGDILITAIGTIGNTYIVREADRFYFKDASVLWMKRTGEVSSEYVSWWLKSSTFFDQLDHGNGATVDTLTINKLRSVVITIPPLAEQQRIARLLDEAFEGITIAKANAEKSRKSASEVYRTVVGESASSLALGIHPFNNKVLPIRIEKLSSLIASGTVKLFRGKIISKRDIARIPGRYPIYSSARDNDGKFGEYGEHMFDEELITWSVDGGGKLFHRKKHKFSVTNVGGILRILDQSIVSYAYLHMLLELRHSQVRFDWVRKAHPSVIRELYINLPIPSMDVQNEVVQRMSEIRQKGDALASIYTQKVNQFDLLKASLLNQVFESRLEAA